MKTKSQNKVSRRHFIKATGAAMVLPMIVPSCVVGRGSRPRPSNRITMGVVGWGMQGPSDCNSLMTETDCQMVAACDLDKNALQSAVSAINSKYQNQDCKGYHDYKEMMAREDIDAVLLAVPDHWHELVATEAARNYKHIYGEKPLARTIAEQQNIVKAVQKADVTWQTGSWQRSQSPFRKACEIVQNGLIGTVTHVEVGLPSGHNDFAGSRPELVRRLASLPDRPNDLSKILPGTPAWDIAVTEPPPELDYQTWIGPSKMEPYIKQRVHKDWRWNYNTGGGQLLDWISHHCDIAHWGLGFDRSGPSEIEGQGDFPDPRAIWNTATKYRIELKYPRDITMTIAGGYSDIRSGAKWIGTDGWVWVDRGGFDGSNPDWRRYRDLPEELRKVKLYVSNNHYRNFLDCVKSGEPTIVPAETAHHSSIPGHLGLISMLTGRKIRWDVASEKILGDPEASKMMTREYRAPYKMG
jgi:predicted dehydrogenase